jgi:hypothetical protein
MAEWKKKNISALGWVPIIEEVLHCYQQCVLVSVNHNIVNLSNGLTSCVSNSKLSMAINQYSVRLTVTAGGTTHPWVSLGMAETTNS